MENWTSSWTKLLWKWVLHVSDPNKCKRSTGETATDVHNIKSAAIYVVWDKP